jgi:radical SAM protein with 4Fe4S-binding SPASM domain
VIESSGDVRPCFFHPVVGNIHRQAFTDIINGQEALSFRASLDVGSNETCKRCVCSLYVPALDIPQSKIPEQNEHNTIAV